MALGAEGIDKGGGAEGGREGVEQRPVRARDGGGAWRFSRGRPHACSTCLPKICPNEGETRQTDGKVTFR